MSGVYQSNFIIERFLAVVAAGNLTQPFVAPCDLEIAGLAAAVTTAPGGTDGVTINLSIFPTSQQGGALTSVSVYTAWSTANVPSILGTSKDSFSTANSQTVIENQPYALGYPLPGPTGTSGFRTAQQTSLTIETPATAPPLMYVYQEGALVAPDNTYLDYNGFTQPASVLHAGDVVTFVIAAGGAGAAVGAAADLTMSLYLSKR